MKRQNASMPLHGQSERQRALIFLSSLSQKGEEHELRPAFNSHSCQHQILTKPKRGRAKCCLSSFYSPHTPPLLKAPFLDGFLPCHSFLLPIAEYSSHNTEGRRARRGQGCLLILEVDSTFLQGNGTP